MIRAPLPEQNDNVEFKGNAKKHVLEVMVVI